MLSLPSLRTELIQRVALWVQTPAGRPGQKDGCSFSAVAVAGVGDVRRRREQEPWPRAGLGAASLKARLTAGSLLLWTTSILLLYVTGAEASSLNANGDAALPWRVLWSARPP